MLSHLKIHRPLSNIFIPLYRATPHPKAQKNMKKQTKNRINPQISSFQLGK